MHLSLRACKVAKKIFKLGPVVDWWDSGSSEFSSDVVEFSSTACDKLLCIKTFLFLATLYYISSSL
jgi:hypothetical protein